MVYDSINMVLNLICYFFKIFFIIIIHSLQYKSFTALVIFFLTVLFF